jgi:hypothetical protein
MQKVTPGFAMGKSVYQCVCRPMSLIVQMRILVWLHVCRKNGNAGKQGWSSDYFFQKWQNKYNRYCSEERCDLALECVFQLMGPGSEISYV